MLEEAGGQGPRAVHTEAPGLMAVSKSRKTQADRRPQGMSLALISKYGGEKLLLGKKKLLQGLPRDCLECALEISLFHGE